ncbi:hypothetical protein [Streptomyces tendae]
MPTIDPDAVRRSALARPGRWPDFLYSDYAGARRVATVAGAPAGFTAALAATQFPPLRRAISRRIRCSAYLPGVRRPRGAHPDPGMGPHGAHRPTAVRGGPADHHTGLVITLDNDTFPPVGAVDDLARLFSFTSVTRWHHASHQVPPDSTNDHIGRVRTPATVVDRTVTWWHGTPHN